MSIEVASTTSAIEYAPAKPAKAFVSHAKLIGILTFLSRILGMAGERRRELF